MQCVKKSDFRTGWRFCKGEIDMAAALEFDDSEWEEVIVPHTWNADDMFPGKSPEEAYIGPAWYRKRFTAAKLENGGRLFLLFEAIANVSEVYVNGCFLGGSEGGFLSFRLDITDALGDREEHIVAVRVDNSFYKGKMPPQTHDWEKYGGMYRPVWLLEKGGAFFVHKSIRIETPEVNESRGRVTVRVRVCEQGTRTRPLIIRHIIKDPARKEIAHLEDTITTRRGATVESNVEFDPIQSPRLWSPETPNVYQIETVLLNGDVELDRESNPLGFRWFEFDADKGFSLNGKSMKLQGVNMHQEYPGLGWACPERYHRREAEMVKSAGMNFMRTSHYPRNERFLDACDELGIMVMEEQPFWHGSLRVSHGEDLIRAARRFSRDMVEQHGNHPSIIMWNTVNEVMLCVKDKEPHPDPDKRTAAMRPLERETPFLLRALETLNDELHRADPSRPTSMIVGGAWRLNEEVGTTRLADIVGYNGGSVNSSVDGRRVYDICKDADPGRISFMTEGVLNGKADNVTMRADWEKELNVWENYADHWQRFYERDWFCGGAMWVFADYSNKGKYRNMAMVDFWRLPMEGYYFFKAMWSEPLMAHICGHWDWTGGESNERRVVVFSNGEEVELFLNGESLGKGKSCAERWPLIPHPPGEWTVPYVPGKLEAVARRGDEVVRDIRETSGEPAGIAVSVENDTIEADGQDIAFVTATVVDPEGRRCYNAFPRIEIEVDGTCRLAGPGVLEARGGIARFAVRSIGQVGESEIRVSSQGLQSASDSVTAVMS